MVGTSQTWLKRTISSVLMINLIGDPSETKNSTFKWHYKLRNYTTAKTCLVWVWTPVSVTGKVDEFNLRSNDSAFTTPATTLGFTQTQDGITLQ